MKLLFPTLLLLFLLSPVANAKPHHRRHRPHRDRAYAARIADIRIRFDYNRRDREWRRNPCPRLRVNSAYDRDTRRNPLTGNVELGHKYEQLPANATTGPCLRKSDYER